MKKIGCQRQRLKKNQGLSSLLTFSRHKRQVPPINSTCLLKQQLLLILTVVGTQSQNRDDITMFINPSTSDKSFPGVTQVAGDVRQERKTPELKVREDVPVYNHTLATILVQYASAVYMSDLMELFTWTCSRCDGLTKGFEVLELVVDVQHCLQAFVGVAEDLNSIVVAFRGTQERSIQNWIEDLLWKQCDINYPGMPDAMVHKGFYSAYHNTTIRHGILQAVRRGKKLYGDIPVMVTGHSMGGAMASFCALDLAVNHKAQNVQLMTFGQPRIGNAAFATYFNQHLPNAFRLVHDHDIVAHLPPYYPFFPQKTYHHFATEVWLYNTGYQFLVYPVEKVCDNSGEDPSCSRSVPGNSISDHLTYFGVKLEAETSVSCRIVMNPLVSDSGVTDPYGNVVFSRDPTSSTLKLNTKANAQSSSVS